MQMLFQVEMSPQDAKRLEAKILEERESGGYDARSLRMRCLKERRKTLRDWTKSSQSTRTTGDSTGWRRLTGAILRLGIYELRQGETPHKVVINESVELAKKFSSEEASGFVNGILDTVRKSLIAPS